MMAEPINPPTVYLLLLDALCEKEGLVASRAADRAFAYGFDLANLGKDFERMEKALSYWWSPVQSMEADEIANGLELIKFLLTFVEYSAAVWVHAYRERVFQLTNAVMGLGVPEDKRGNIRVVSEKLQQEGHLPLHAHLKLLREERPSAVGSALTRRNEFIHRLPEQEDWPSLRSGAQLQESLDIDEATGLPEAREMALVDIEADNLERKREELIQFLRSVSDELDAFEEQFCVLLFAACSRGSCK